jgi:hypothetical protein
MERIKKSKGPIFYIVVYENGKRVKHLADRLPGGRFVIAEPNPFDPDRDAPGEMIREESQAEKTRRIDEGLKELHKETIQKRAAEQRAAEEYLADGHEGMEGGGYRKKRYSKRTLKNRRRRARKTKANRRRL